MLFRKNKLIIFYLGVVMLVGVAFALQGFLFTQNSVNALEPLCASDTDNGINYYQKGTVSNNGMKITEETDYEGEETQVLSPNDARILVNNKWYDISRDGTYNIEYMQAYVSEINYYDAQHQDNNVTLQLLSISDFCAEDTLYEFNCLDYDMDDSYQCPNGCYDGACLTTYCKVDATGCKGLNYPDIMYGTVTFEDVWNGSEYELQKVCSIMPQGCLSDCSGSTWSFEQPMCAVIEQLESCEQGYYCYQGANFYLTSDCQWQNYNQCQDSCYDGECVEKETIHLSDYEGSGWINMNLAEDNDWDTFAYSTKPNQGMEVSIPYSGTIRDVEWTFKLEVQNGSGQWYAFQCYRHDQGAWHNNMYFEVFRDWAVEKRTTPVSLSCIDNQEIKLRVWSATGINRYYEGELSFVQEYFEDLSTASPEYLELKEKITNLNLRVTSLERRVVKQEKELMSSIDNNLSTKLKGYILLQVEENGEAWYVDPVTGKKFYLKDGDSAYNALRVFGLGITNENLAKIPIGIEDRAVVLDSDADGLGDKLEESLSTNLYNQDSDGDGHSDYEEIKTGFNPNGPGQLIFDINFANSLKGKILLQVESRGEAWYVNPVDGKRYYMKDGELAYQIMKFLSLGITNENLRKIDVGEF